WNFQYVLNVPYGSVPPPTPTAPPGRTRRGAAHGIHRRTDGPEVRAGRPAACRGADPGAASGGRGAAVAGRPGGGSRDQQGEREHERAAAGAVGRGGAGGGRGGPAGLLLRARGAAQPDRGGAAPATRGSAGAAG